MSYHDPNRPPTGPQPGGRPAPGYSPDSATQLSTPGQQAWPGAGYAPQGQPGQYGQPAGSQAQPSGPQYPPPGSVYPPGAGLQPPPRRSPLLTILVVVLALAILAVGGAIAYLLLRPKDSGVAPTAPATPSSSAPASTSPEPAGTPSPSASSSRPSASPSSNSPSPSPTKSPSPSGLSEADAIAKLGQYRDGDSGSVQPQGQWVATLSSKWIGVTDPLQTTQSGSHTFMAADILREHEAIRRAQNQGASVRMIYGTDFGTQQTHNGNTVYITIAVADWSSRSDVQAWCAGRYPGLSGADLDNVCMPLQLTAKH